MVVRKILCLTFVFSLLCLSQATAQSQGGSGDFTFKRVSPPGPNVQKRLTIQILPQDSDAGLVGAPSGVANRVKVPARQKASRSRAEWFWERVNPALEPPEDGRWIEAVGWVSAAGKANSLPNASLQVMTDIVRNHGADILRHSAAKGVSPALVASVIAVESAGRIDAVSHAGAEGLMQLIPATADRFNVSDPTNPSENIRAGVTYLEWLMGQFYGDPILALAGYNAGENSVRAHGGVPPFSETRTYIPKVLAAWNVARELCKTPPDLPQDGCIFKDL